MLKVPVQRLATIQWSYWWTKAGWRHFTCARLCKTNYNKATTFTRHSRLWICQQRRHSSQHIQQHIRKLLQLPQHSRKLSQVLQHSHKLPQRQHSHKLP